MDAGACSSPERFQLGGRLIHPLQILETEELFLVKRLLVFKHEIDGPTQFVGEDREGLGFAVFTGKPLEKLFTGLIAFKEKDGSLREGPLKVGVTDLFATGAVFFAVGFFDAFDQTAVGDEVLDPREAFNGFDLVKDNQAEDSSDPGNGLEQGIGSEVVFFSTGDDIVFELGQEVVIGLDDFQVDSHALLDGRVIETLGDAFSVLGFGNATQGIRKVILASGVLPACRRQGYGRRVRLFFS